ncbi:MAG: hypothetical protein DBX47_04470 [Clostridiales bacterium]|nr:MAG: hypothetical protein DBX47_04470 [Clostridiales bacterium]
MRKTEINEKLIEEYAKKIYGFAYSKTHDYHDSMDLSQNILMNLCKINFLEKKIENKDSYIYKICQYTWSNFVRENIRIWQGVNYDEAMKDICSDKSVEEELEKNELYQKLRQEIMYLSKTKRDVTVMFYYENKSGKEISEILGVPASTIRWYLSESKKILKERIKMINSIYQPIKLSIYFNGWAPDYNLAGLRNNLLSQNICIVCQKKPLTIEEIAITLGMSAAFVENKLEPLVNMNYIEKVGTNKFKTNFFISDADFYIAQKKFEFENIPPLAKIIFEEVKNNLFKIKNIGFIGCNLDEEFLLWDFYTEATHAYLNDTMIKSEVKAPIRGENGAHWIIAYWPEEEILQHCEKQCPDFIDYIKYSSGNAGKHTGNEKLCIRQFDPPYATQRRELFNDKAQKIQRVYTIIKENIKPNNYDKEIIAELSALGYAAVNDGKPQMLIPYFTKEEHEKLKSILVNTIIPSVKKRIVSEINKDYAIYIKKLIPSCVSVEEKEFISTQFYQPNAFSWLMLKGGFLNELSDNEKKRVCTIAYEK